MNLVLVLVLPGLYLWIKFLCFLHSICIVKFASRPDEQFLLVGVVKDLVLVPKQNSGGFVYVYKLSETGDKLDFVHKTPVDDVPSALVPFQGRVLIGVGKCLRIYDLGKKKLLRKCENKVLY